MSNNRSSDNLEDLFTEALRTSTYEKLVHKIGMQRLKSLLLNIRETCRLSFDQRRPTILYRDNTTCIAQVKGGYIKSDRTMHISPNFSRTTKE